MGPRKCGPQDAGHVAPEAVGHAAVGCAEGVAEAREVALHAEAAPQLHGKEHEQGGDGSGVDNQAQHRDGITKRRGLGPAAAEAALPVDRERYVAEERCEKQRIHDHRVQTAQRKVLDWAQRAVQVHQDGHHESVAQQLDLQRHRGQQRRQ